MEALQTILLSGIGGPCLAAVQQTAEDTGLVYFEFAVLCEVAVVPHSPV